MGYFRTTPKTPHSHGSYEAHGFLCCNSLLFLSVGAFFAGIFKNPKKSVAAATSVMMVMYLLAVIVDIVEKELDFLKYLSFFKYYDAKDLLKRGYSPIYPVISAVVIAAFLYCAYHYYQRRDMKI